MAPGGPLDKRVRAAEREHQEVEGIVAALSADDRRAPSCYDRGASRLADRFRALEGARTTCRPLVKPNPDYFDPKLPYGENLCKLVEGKNLDLWNSSWITDATLKAKVDPSSIVNKKQLKALRPIVPRREFGMFRLY